MSKKQKSKRPKLIGLSLGLCCAEMAKGTVNPDDVKLIISRTSVRTRKAFMKMIRQYLDGVWTDLALVKHRKKAARLARKFYREGKVEQPLLTTGMQPDFDYEADPRSIWVTNRKKIQWWR
ncbi:MAG: hypothetical protein RL292_427 [Candidatus Parcubacteria bacterium]|jgi:hypothetical protein